jgi:predicted SnoaL-like aldol condensation-catalyzing enzyme
MEAPLKHQMGCKEIATNFLALVIAGQVKKAYDDHVDGSHFQHHNPYFEGNVASLRDGMEQNEKVQPGKKLVVYHVIEDDDLVAVHSHLIVKKGELEMAVVHIFRFQDNKIVELWDIAQQVPKEMTNQFGMF